MNITRDSKLKNGKMDVECRRTSLIDKKIFIWFSRFGGVKEETNKQTRILFRGRRIEVSTAFLILFSGNREFA